MDLGDLRAELLARGFDDLDTTRANRFINDARALLDNAYLWPYREASATGTAPLSITDLGVVERVTNEDLDYPLSPGDFRWLTDQFGDLALAGLPMYFYVATPAGNPEVAIYPTSSATIGVQYYKRTPLLVNDTDVPLAPVDYHLIYVDLAVVRAHLDDDNFQAAQATQQFADGRIAKMVDDLCSQQIAGPSSVQTLTWAVDA